MKAVVLAGGAGTRLAPFTRVLPKPLLPIGDKPILEIIVSQLQGAGIREVTIATGYLSGLIETYFGDGGAHGVQISCVREQEALGTAGPLASIDGLDETFIMMNGDVLADPVYDSLLETHRRSEAVATIATHRQEIQLDYGVVDVSDEVDGLTRIQRIDEKPCHVCEVSMGIYAFEPRVLDYIDEGKRCDFPELIERLLAAGELVVSHHHDGYWIDVGQLNHLESAVQEYESGAERFLGRSNSAGERTSPRPTT